MRCWSSIFFYSVSIQMDSVLHQDIRWQAWKEMLTVFFLAFRFLENSCDVWVSVFFSWFSGFYCKIPLTLLSHNWQIKYHILHCFVLTGKISSLGLRMHDESHHWYGHWSGMLSTSLAIGMLITVHIKGRIACHLHWATLGRLFVLVSLPNRDQIDMHVTDYLSCRPRCLF